MGRVRVLRRQVPEPVSEEIGAGNRQKAIPRGDERRSAPSDRRRAATGSDISKPSRPLQARRAGPNPFGIPVFALAPCRASAYRALRRAVRSRNVPPLARPTGQVAARVPSQFLDVSPRAHARYGDAEGGEKMARERGDMPSAHASAAHPRIRRGCPPRAIPCGRFLKALPQAERRYRTVRDFLRVEVCRGFVGGSAEGADWSAAPLADVGSFVGEGLI